MGKINPSKIAVNGRIDGFCDGLSSTMFEQLREALGESSEKLHDKEGLVLRWLQRVSPLEKEVMKALSDVTHSIISTPFRDSSFEWVTLRQRMWNGSCGMSSIV